LSVHKGILGYKVFKVLKALQEHKEYKVLLVYKDLQA
jgi:hypothetical protein